VLSVGFIIANGFLGEATQGVLLMFQACSDLAETGGAAGMYAVLVCHFLCDIGQRGFWRGNARSAADVSGLQ
jgi:hypothetical protein